MTDELRVAEPTDDELVRTHLGAALRLARMLVGNNAGAEDIAAESVARLLVARRKVRVENAESYLRRIVVNLVIGGRRRRATEQRFAHRFAVAPDGPRSDDQVVGRAALAAALDRLAPRQRAVLVLRYYEDLPEATVAELLHVPLGTVKSTASRALETLRELLAPEDDDG